MNDEKTIIQSFEIGKTFLAPAASPYIYDNNVFVDQVLRVAANMRLVGVYFQSQVWERVFEPELKLMPLSKFYSSVHYLSDTLSMLAGNYNSPFFIPDGSPIDSGFLPMNTFKVNSSDDLQLCDFILSQGRNYGFNIRLSGQFIAALAGKQIRYEASVRFLLKYVD